MAASPNGSRPDRGRGAPNGDHDCLGGRRVTPSGDVVVWDENVRFGEVGRGTSARYIGRHDAKIPGVTLLAAVMARDVDGRLGGAVAFTHVVWMEKDHAATAVNAAIGIAWRVDCRIELIVCPYRRKQQLTRSEAERGQGMDGEPRPSCRCEEEAFARRIRQVEAARSSNAFVVSLEARDHSLDRVADAIVVAGELFPRDATA